MIHQAYICFHLYKTHHSNPFMLYNHPSKHKSNTTTDGIFFQKKKVRGGKESQSRGEQLREEHSRIF